uniref:C3H1-type domain-containing protein n=1 Tax=Chromera velia CCMP2878 TaxID=1169474 RepID=A0A0G4HIN7_9ALVE|eukprot:Cvel_7033.t1-p1 / transcript=Cvel_7033.t1 / gene=Cvel_7033 / organism=Chromera_velia_CCMP2878 / gene_product=Zinc finger CCCH domain-containing protein 47, putative / transcript_product=Zinc finger CCCH domain-containing protein 47, putative / location=Cvel_scaffold359:947-3460(+) / protein_length=580 / sequence_SO=supercontig / SO=protein_coding / is_pseudo=false
MSEWHPQHRLSKSVIKAADLYKVKLCQEYQQGSCRKGRSCTYAHGPEELRAPPDLYKTKLCSQWLEGGCTRSPCNFAHGPHELRKTAEYHKISLCRYYARGQCFEGPLCRFAHGVEELRDDPRALARLVDRRRFLSARKSKPQGADEQGGSAAGDDHAASSSSAAASSSRQFIPVPGMQDGGPGAGMPMSTAVPGGGGDLLPAGTPSRPVTVPHHLNRPSLDDPLLRPLGFPVAAAAVVAAAAAATGVAPQSTVGSLQVPPQAHTAFLPPHPSFPLSNPGMNPGGGAPHCDPPGGIPQGRDPGRLDPHVVGVGGRQQQGGNGRGSPPGHVPGPGWMGQAGVPSNSSSSHGGGGLGFPNPGPNPGPNPVQPSSHDPYFRDHPAAGNPGGRGGDGRYWGGVMADRPVSGNPGGSVRGAGGSRDPPGHWPPGSSNPGTSGRSLPHNPHSHPSQAFHPAAKWKTIADVSTSPPPIHQYAPPAYTDAFLGGPPTQHTQAAAVAAAAAAASVRQTRIDAAPPYTAESSQAPTWFGGGPEAAVQQQRFQQQHQQQPLLESQHLASPPPQYPQGSATGRADDGRAVRE